MLNIPTRAEVTSSLQSYVRTFLPDLDPTVTRRRGFIGGMVRSLASMGHDWYVRLKRYADHEPFPQTATENFFSTGWWIDITNLPRNPAAPAQGKVVITGTNGTILAKDAVVSSGNQDFTVDASTAVVTQSVNISSLTRDGTTAIAETSSPHFLATGQTLTMSGATQTEYNVAAVITVTAANEFTFTVAGSPTTPATGSPKASGTWGNADLKATVSGVNTNVDSGASLSISSPPSGLNSAALVTFGGLAGGADLETLDAWRERVLEALGSDYGTFTGDEIEIVAKQVPGVTRVWVQKATLGGTNGVNEGQVRVAFVRDDDANIFPSSQEVSTVKARIIDLTMPAHTAEEDVMVVTPVKLSVNFVFTAISPDTASMRRAIEASLRQFFAEGVDFATDIDEDSYRCAIKESFDTERGQSLTSFTLSSPTGTISVAAVTDPELPALGTITWP